MHIGKGFLKILSKSARELHTVNKKNLFYSLKWDRFSDEEKYSPIFASDLALLI